MEMKQCTKCLNVKAIDLFSWLLKNIKRQTICKECHKSVCKNHYKENKEYYLAKTRKRKKDIKSANDLQIYNYLLANPCVDCGEREPLFLEFDHQRDKMFNVSAKLHNFQWVDLLKEIQKCEVRCVKCHRVRTCANLNTYRYQRYIQNIE
jgi:hypothetical protein